jgi:hypothetical protein
MHPKTFVWGNFLMAAGILLIICFQLFNKDLKGAIIELPFLMLNLVILFFNTSLKKSTKRIITLLLAMKHEPLTLHCQNWG